MRYDKPPLSFEAQANLLISRGLIADKKDLIARLQTVNYYRLSAYLYPFRNFPHETYIDKTTLILVWKHYTFDRQLRILVMDAIERVEVAIRTQLIHFFVDKYGPFDYQNACNLPKLDTVKYERWEKELTEEVSRSKETFIVHFKSKYGIEHPLPPLWMLTEVMSFGKMLTLFNGVDDEIRRKIAHEYGVQDNILQSWLGTINVVRNISAHHCRLWNRELGYKPLFPKKQKYPQWHNPFTLPNNRIFAILTILKYLLTIIAPTSKWSERFYDLLQRYPEIVLTDMGFPENWKKHSVWSNIKKLL
jgi:abortive infection bacteriophage resistance protein